ncbi:hypothetical protein [Gehongia tenuis]|uniref:Uncharacterized protein n=1 Tax=Gehongia tenuis TaxID=2763655 RepID=A0A926D391_9FIRM|nr:hypothetical protein [Gehongia tenuis]MBC8530948.1 hypothetical protein [Gehongia tenuis]
MKTIENKNFDEERALYGSQRLIGTGCGTPEMTKKSVHMREAYELGKSI